jgi:hypothetical protein
MTMNGRIPARSALALLVAIGALVVTAASASAMAIYNNLPKPAPGDLVSQSFEATGTSEWGGQVEFKSAGKPKRVLSSVTLGMSSYACQTGSGLTCASGKMAKFKLPITLNVYAVNPANQEPVQPALASVTQEFEIPYRPSASALCPVTSEGVGWGAECKIGRLHEITFAVPGAVTVANTAIVAVAFNTENYGAAPTGKPGPENSLNVATNATYSYNETAKEFELGSGPAPSIGADPLPSDAYINSVNAGEYGSTPDPGQFALASGNWAGFQPAFEIKAS